MWPWLYDDEEDRRLFTALQSQLKFIKDFVESGCAAVHHLESALLGAACSDPTVAMEKQLVLPLIRDRIHAAAKDVSRAQDQDQSENTVRTCVLCVLECHGIVVLCLLACLLLMLLLSGGRYIHCQVYRQTVICSSWLCLPYTGWNACLCVLCCNYVYCRERHFLFLCRAQ